MSQEMDLRGCVTLFLTDVMALLYVLRMVNPVLLTMQVHITITNCLIRWVEVSRKSDQQTITSMRSGQMLVQISDIMRTTGTTSRGCGTTDRCLKEEAMNGLVSRSKRNMFKIPCVATFLSQLLKYWYTRTISIKGEDLRVGLQINMYSDEQKRTS